MLVVDSGIWIDFFNARPSAGRVALGHLLDHGEVRLVVPDLVLFEVLRGFRHERDHRQAKALMESLDVEPTADHALAVAAAGHYRSLRALGFTVRSPVDVLVAAFCIEHDYALLHDDRDFTAFEARRGLRAWRH
ncbi:MAG: PIN domain-containing protein [Burkholderiales bacterium]|nr:PIN domain-containing protein [Burkholderiales bacterium]MDE2567062.1 PIN domain-containing protein [Burkholderiales bacterium]